MKQRGNTKTTLGVEDMVEIQSRANLQPVPEGPIDDITHFRTAIGLANLHKIGFVEVTDKLFDYLTQGQNTHYICYGSPMVKVYRAGTREKIDKWENMNIDEKNKTTWDQVIV